MLDFGGIWWIFSVHLRFFLVTRGSFPPPWIEPRQLKISPSHPMTRSIRNCPTNLRPSTEPAVWGYGRVGKIQGSFAPHGRSSNQITSHQRIMFKLPTGYIWYLWACFSSNSLWASKKKGLQTAPRISLALWSRMNDWICKNPPWFIYGETTLPAVFCYAFFR